ncbi:MAG: integration host factor subunit beta [Chitinivibrionales bacterium]|nr:integration host factor subunit beta [Chitinivibrionales bacterium]
MSNINKHDLIVDVSKVTGITQADTTIGIEELLKTISKFLETGQHIELRGFGTFYTKIRKARPARNPKTGEVVPLPRRVVPLFKYSHELKGKIATEMMGAPYETGKIDR